MKPKSVRREPCAVRRKPTPPQPSAAVAIPATSRSSNWKDSEAVSQPPEASNPARRHFVTGTRSQPQSQARFSNACETVAALAMRIPRQYLLQPKRRPDGAGQRPPTFSVVSQPRFFVTRQLPERARVARHAGTDSSPCKELGEMLRRTPNRNRAVDIDFRRTAHGARRTYS